MVAACIALLITSSLAVYYRSEAVQARRDMTAMTSRLGKSGGAGTIREPDFDALKMTTLRSGKSSSSVNSAPATSTDKKQPGQPMVFDRGQGATSQTNATERRSSDRGRSPFSGSDWLEVLRTNDVKRYEEIQKRREEIRQYIENAWAQKTNYFMNRDMSNMTEPEFQEYALMMNLLEDTRVLSQKLQAPLSHDDRHQVMDTVRSNMVQLAPLMDNERNREYYDLAKGMGHDDNEASAMVNYINQITSNTSLRTILPFGSHGGGMWGGGERPPGPGTSPQQPVPAAPTK